MLQIHPDSTCDVCLDSYSFTNNVKAPHTIPCGHSFCYECLAQLNPSSCPLCRKPFSAIDDIKKLHVNHPVPGEREMAMPDAWRFVERLSRCAHTGVDIAKTEVEELIGEAKRWLETGNHRKLFPEVDATFSALIRYMEDSIAVLSDGYFPLQLDNGLGALSRGFSTSGPSSGLPAVLPFAPPMTLFPSYNDKQMVRPSSVSDATREAIRTGHGDVTCKSETRTVNFRPLGGRLDGITLTEAMNSVPLSPSHSYAVRDIADMRGRLSLKVRWAGNRSLVYDIPVDSDFNGSVKLQSLVRRIARAIVHFMEKNSITLHLDRVVVLGLRKTQPDKWIPVLLSPDSLIVTL